jgi:hypothetical protein
MSQTFEDAGRFLAGQTATISFWAKLGDDASFSAVSSRLLSATVQSAEAIITATNGAFNVATTGYQNLGTTPHIDELSTSWVRMTSVYEIPADADALQMNFIFTPSGTAGADDSIYITGVQLEAGSVATPFKRHAPSLQGELAACQRYFERIAALGESTGYNIGNGYIIATTGGQYAFNFTTKRVIPTIIPSAATDFIIIHRGTTAAPTSISFSRTGPDRGRFILGGSSGLTLYEGSQAAFANSSNGFIDIIAEL